MPRYDLFEQRYSVANEDKCADNIPQTLLCDSPTLYVLRDAYGHDNTVAWLFVHLSAIALMIGVRKGDDIMSHQLTSLARVILHNYPQLRATDLMLFFSRFKAGYYGRFYGTFDPMVVSDALNQFAEWCRLQRGLILTQRHIEQQRHLPPPDTSRCISYSEFLALRSRRLQLRLCRQHFFSRHHCRDQPTAGS